MAKMKHSIEWMVARVNDYLDDKGSYETIAKDNGIGSCFLQLIVTR